MGLKKVPSFQKFKLFSRKRSDSNKLISIGAHTYIDKSCLIAPYKSPICVGRYCSLAPNVTLINKSHHLNALSTCFIHKRIANIEPDTKKMLDRRSIYDTGSIRIGNDVWIGVNSVILGGVTIGDGSVVGANSVVTNDIKPYCVYAGLPAKKVSQRFDEDIVKVLKESEWWNYEPEDLLEAFGESLYEDLSMLRPDQLLDILSRLKKASSQ